MIVDFLINMDKSRLKFARNSILGGLLITTGLLFFPAHTRFETFVSILFHASLFTLILYMLDRNNRSNWYLATAIPALLLAVQFTVVTIHIILNTSITDESMFSLFFGIGCAVILYHGLSTFTSCRAFD